MLPAFVMRQTEIDLHEGSPFRSFGFAHQMETGFLGRAIGFARVTRNAGADNILPRCGAPSVPRRHVVEVQIFALENFPAILTGISIALENIMPREFDLFFGQAIKHDEQDHARDANLERNGVNAFWMRLLKGKILPLRKIKSLKRPFLIGKDNVGVAFKKKAQRASRGANIDRLPEAIQNQNMLVEKRSHKFF